MRSPPRNALRRAAVPLLVGAAFFAGLSADHVARAARRGAGQPYRTLDIFADVLSTIQNAYVEEVREKDLVYGAIDGMMARLDAHSVFLRPDELQALQEETSGEFDGVGLELTVRDEALVVVAPIADGPAARAGIRAGDQVVRIDGAPTRELSLGEAVRRMKGPAGTRLTLDVARDRDARGLVLVRERVHARSVDWQVVDRGAALVAIRIKSFQDRTDAALGEALEAARAQLGGAIGGLVLDLRDDPGGLVDQAVRVADRFLENGIIVTTERRGARSVDVERAHGPGTEPRYPVVVLVNGGTASASEIVAGALQDHARAVVMGTRTFGKGSVQSVIELEDGSGLKLTVARYYTPRHRSIQDKGIVPDVVVADAPAGPLRDTTATPMGDDQLRTAIEHLRLASLARDPSGFLPGASDVASP